MNKIWVTFSSSTSLGASGLKRAYFWLEEPVYTFYKRWKDSEIDGLSTYGWSIPGKPNGKCYSVGDFFGYDSQISVYIWQKLCDFFESENLIDWDSKAEGKTPDLFLLEIDISLSFRTAGEN